MVDFNTEKAVNKPVIEDTTKEVVMKDEVIGQKPTKVASTVAPSIRGHLEMLQGSPITSGDYLLLPKGTSPGIRVIDSNVPPKAPYVGGPANIGADFKGGDEKMKPDKASKKGTIKIVIIYAPWCGWSKKYLNEFKKMESKLNLPPSESTNGYEVICELYNSEDSKGKEKVKEYKVRGFPSVFVEVNGERKEGPREYHAMVKMINSKTGGSLK